MGSGGTDYEIGDVISAARLNQKSTFVGTGAQIAALGTTYVGQKAYCITTGSGFQADREYVRNAANTAWNPVGVDELPYLKLSNTIGDYSQPASATASSESEDSFTPDAVWGPSDNQTIEQFNLWANQAALDAAFPSSSSTYAVASYTNQRIDAFMDGSFAGATQYLYHDIKAAIFSNTKFIKRFKLTITTIDNCSGGTGQGAIYISLQSGTGAYNTSQDRIILSIESTATTKQYRVESTDGVAFAFGSGNVFTHAAAIETVYVEVRRTSTTNVRVTLSTTSAYDADIETVNHTVVADVQDLRYLHVQTYDNCTAGDIVLQVDDIQIQDNSGEIYTASKAVDNSTTTQWKSNSEANPRIYVDLTSDRELVSLALHIDKTLTTITSFKVRATSAATGAVFADADNIAYVNISDFTDDTWRYMANNFLSENKRYVQFYANETGVFAINEIKARYGVTDLRKIMDHRHRTRGLTAADSHVDAN